MNKFWQNSVQVKRFIQRERANVVGFGVIANWPEPGQTSISTLSSKKPHRLRHSCGIYSCPHFAIAFLQQHRFSAAIVLSRSLLSGRIRLPAVLL